MSSPDPKSSRRINPATCSHEELFAHLGTDPRTGLSPKEAERRLLHTTGAPLYGTSAPRVGDCIKRLLKDPVLWLLLAVSIFALFFDRVLLGLVCFALTAGHTALCVFLDRRAARLDAAMQTMDAPLSRVLRNRRVLRIGAAGVVRGDILLFYPGDMIPADCRLLVTRSFTVSEREIDASEPDRTPVYLEKDAASTADSRRPGRLSPPNMVFAGGTVERGYALAAVVATGARTHLGGLVGSVAPAHARRAPAFFRAAGKYLSIYNLLCVAFIIPAVTVGIFALKDTHEFLDIFLSVVALMGVTLAEHLLARARFTSALLRRDAATDRDSRNTADIKSGTQPEKLLSMTDIFLVGTAALHDGGAHPETMTVGESTYRFDTPEADDPAREVVELLYLYYYAHAPLPATRADGADADFAAEADALTPAVCDWADIDPEALLLKYPDVEPEDGCVTVALPDGDRHRFMTLRIAPDYRTAEALSTVPAPYYDAYTTARREGLRTLFFIVDATVRALITYTPRVSPKTAGLIRAFEDAGIRVTAYLRTNTPEDERILNACGLSLSETAFAGCSEKRILRDLRDRQDAGGTVAVLSADRGDLELLYEADIAVTCAPSFFATAEDGIPHRKYDDEDSTDDTTVATAPLTGPDGLPAASMATDLCRRTADIWVRRTAPDGGGLGGLRRALAAADAIKAATDRTFGFLLLSQTVRVIFFIFAVVGGLTPLSAPLFLFSGLCVDTFVTLVSARLPVGDPPTPRRPMEKGIIPPWRNYRGRLIAAAVSAALPWLVAHIAAVFGTSFGADPLYYALPALLLFQLAIFRTGLDKSARRSRTAFLITLALGLAYIGALALALGAGLSPLWALLLPFIPSLCYFLLFLLLRRLLPPEA